MVRVIRGFVPDDLPRVTSDAGGPMDELIQLALDRFSADSPREASDPDALPTGDGTQSLPLPTTYVIGYSEARGFEYPVGSIPPELQPDDGWSVNDRAETIETPGFTVPSGSSYRFIHTTPHALYGLDGETADTSIPRPLFRAVGALAASYIAERLSSHYAQTVDGQFGADVAGFRTKSQEWSSRATALRKIYTDALFPKKEDGIRPRGAFVNWGLCASDDLPYTRDARYREVV